MLNVVKDGIFWVFMVIFMIVIFAAIIFVFFVTFEKLRAAFVNWLKSEELCAEVDKDTFFATLWVLTQEKKQA
jgi:flagellar basal body-associated protein FliL